MRHFKAIILSILALLAAAGLGAQNLTDLRIGEVLAENPDGLVDGFGQRNGWIEIFNSSYGTVKFGGCYLSDDASDLRKYHIPTSDRSTQVGPRQSVVFYTSGDASQGTYYTNFKLHPGVTVYLVSNDGRTIIDQVEIPSDLPAGKSVVKIPVGVKEMDFETRINDKPSPGAYNGDVDAKTKSQIMKEKDPHGWTLTLISVLVVFTALIILAFIFGWIGNYNKRKATPSNHSNHSNPSTGSGAKGKGEMTPEVAAAISMALERELGGEAYAAIALALDSYLGGGIHDTESLVITINPTPGSTWADKAQNFRQLPR